MGSKGKGSGCTCNAFMEGSIPSGSTNIIKMEVMPKTIAGTQNITFFKNLNGDIAEFGLRRCVWDADIVGSNPTIPTIKADLVQSGQNNCLVSRRSGVRIPQSAPKYIKIKDLLWSFFIFLDCLFFRMSCLFY